MPIPAGTLNAYADVGLLKQHLGIKDSDTSRDGLLEQKLAAASRYIDRITNRRFGLDPAPSTRVYRTRGRLLVDRDTDSDLLLVDDIAAEDGLAVSLGGPGSWSPYTGWLVEPADSGQPFTMLRGSWPGTTVQVTAVFGWPAVPDEVVEATLLQAARLWKRKDSPEGIAGSAEWGAIRVGRIDPDVQALTAHLVIHAIV